MKEMVSKRRWNSFDMSESYDDDHPETSLNMSNDYDDQKSICFEDLDEDW